MLKKPIYESRLSKQDVRTKLQLTTSPTLPLHTPANEPATAWQGMEKSRSFLDVVLPHGNKPWAVATWTAQYLDSYCSYCLISWQLLSLMSHILTAAVFTALYLDSYCPYCLISWQLLSLLPYILTATVLNALYLDSYCPYCLISSSQWGKKCNATFDRGHITCMVTAACAVCIVDHKLL
jgi:hypothetical protein